LTGGFDENSCLADARVGVSTCDVARLVRSLRLAIQRATQRVRELGIDATEQLHGGRVVAVCRPLAERNTADRVAGGNR
jgi:hypothetical protein